MKHITSRENSIYKDTLKLTRKKYRDRGGQFLLEGIKTLRDAVEIGTCIDTVFIDESKYDELAAELNWMTDIEDRICLLAGSLFGDLSDTENSQGVISVVRKPEITIAELGTKAEDGNIVVLDRLQDPGNIGTIIRTAEAAGYKAIVTVKGTGDVYSPKVSRAAAGSLLRMPVMDFETAEQAAEVLHDIGKKLAVTCLEGAVSCFEMDLSKNIALVIGNEGQGVSREFLELADIKVTIPMKGQIESLNAAVAAGILMYQSIGGKS